MNKEYKTAFGDDITSKIADGFCSNNQNKPNGKYKTSFGEDTISKTADGFTNSNKDSKKYCSNCHREIYASNYTGTDLCTECKKYYY